MIDSDLVLKEDKSEQQYVTMYRDARDFDTTRFDEYAELMAYYEGRQNQLQINQSVQPWVIKMDTAYAADAINIRIASLVANDYVGELEPLSPEDVESIKNLNTAYHNMWKEMNMDNLINDAINRAAIIRESYIHVVYDDKIKGGTNTRRIGTLKGYFIDPASVMIDPKALSFRDADYVVISERVSKRQVLSMYPEFDVKEVQMSSTPDERGEIYTGTDYSTHQDTALQMLTFYEQSEEGIYKTVLLESKFLQKPELMPIGVLPIAQLRWEKRIKSPFGISLMDRLISQQKSINAVESAITTAALAFASPSYAVRKDSGINPKAVAKLAGAPGAVFAVNGDPSTAIVPISIKGVDQQLPIIKQDIQAGIYRLAGISEQFLGSFGTSGNSAGGAKEAAARSRVVENNVLRQMEEFIEDLTYITVEFITKAFEGEKFYTRGNKKSTGDYDFGNFDITPAMKETEFSFAINMDVKTPYSKENTKTLLQELYQFERQYDAPVKVINVLDILSTYNIPNVQELEERYKQLTQKDTSSKAKIITAWVTITAKYGIDQQIISQGISEIIEGKETPTVEKTLAELQIRQQQEAAQQQAMQQQALAKETALKDQLMQEQYKMQTKPTGDEVFQAEGGQSAESNPANQPITGDETFQAGQ